MPNKRTIQATAYTISNRNNAFKRKKNTDSIPFLKIYFTHDQSLLYIIGTHKTHKNYFNVVFLLKSPTYFFLFDKKKHHWPLTIFFLLFKIKKEINAQYFTL